MDIEMNMNITNNNNLNNINKSKKIQDFQINKNNNDNNCIGSNNNNNHNNYQDNNLNGKLEDEFDDKNIFNFPDFFELDLVNSWNENKCSEDINIRPLLNIIKKNKILLLQNLDQFYVNSIVYFHREVIYKGKISIFEYDNQVIKDCLIKKCSINNFNELTLVCKELEIYYFLRNCYNETTPEQKEDFKNPFCDLLACYFDVEENYFYIFYEYFPSFLGSQMLLEKLNLKQKLIMIRKILYIIKFIHSLGVLNRDIKLESFLIDENLNLKLFDISNSMRIDDLPELNNSDNLFITPKWVSPEITRCYPKHGYHQDIWSLGCSLIELLLDYDKYKNHLLEKLMSKIFSVEKNSEYIPKIPKDIEEDCAVMINGCLMYNTSQRLNILDVIKILNEVLKRNEIKEVNVYEDEYHKIKSYTEKSHNKYLYRIDENILKLGNCIHEDIIRNFYCIDCNQIICEKCIKESHDQHKYINILLDLENKSSILVDLFTQIDSIICETTFNYIENFKQSFENDFIKEENRIKNMFREISKSLDNLEKIQLEALKKSRDEFLYNKFDHVFKEAEITKKYYSFYKESKSQFFSHFHRLNNSLKTNEINIRNYSSFKEFFDKFHEYSEVLKHYSNNLNKKCNDLKLSGKYTFRHENYSEEISKYLKATASKISLDKHKFFDYLGYDILQINKELLMVIPLTNCVVSYQKNIYKKMQCDFDEKNTKIKNFLPGSSTLHVKDMFYITGGELHDEPVSFFLSVKIHDKVVEELVELNYARRFHTMLNIMDRYIVVIGGWNSNQVEIIDLNSLKIWEILPSMSCERSDCTAYLLNEQYIYVFGGWDYNTKICIPDVEKYELFDSNQNINFKNKWDIIKIKNNAMFLQKYNMGLIPLINERTDYSEKILLVGGFDDEYDYSSSVITVDIRYEDDIIYVTKDIKGLPTDGESSFWYEKSFHLIKNEIDNEILAVNFNSFNNLYAYSFNKQEFKLFINELN